MDKGELFKSIIEKVKVFHETFGIKNNTSPTMVNDNIAKLRFDLMIEEVNEYKEAHENNDLVEIADSLGDQLYILCGTILAHGLQDMIEPIFNEIQNSNMSKLGEKGKPIYREDGKVLKGPSYFKPNIAKLLEE